MSDKCQVVMSSKAAVRPASPVPRKRIVSAKIGQEKSSPTSVRFPQEQLEALHAVAADRHVSFKRLVVEALDRCQRDGVWKAGEAPCLLPDGSVLTHPVVTGLCVTGKEVSATTVPVPVSTHQVLVDLSNVLVALAFAAEEWVGSPRRTAKRRQEAQAIVDDACARLEAVRKLLGC